MYISCLRTNDYFYIRELNETNSSLCKKIPYRTNLYLETNSSDNEFIGFKSKASLKQFEFYNSKDYYDFKEKFKGRLYGDIEETLQYLSTLELDHNNVGKINPWAIDIEVYSESDFPSPDKASQFPIVSISLINMFTNKVFTWVYDKNKKCTLQSKRNWDINIFYDEKSMFDDFLKFWKTNLKYIHVLTGWNSNEYDIPYLINRINYIFSNSTQNISNQVKMLSPFKLVKSHTNRINGEITFSIAGLPTLDYLQLFKKFNFESYPSYKLEEISQTELKTGKLDHSQYISFADFYNKDINTFVEYNRIDVELIKQLDDKFKLIILAVNIAYICHINFEQVYSPIKCWEAMLYNDLLKSKIIIPPRNHNLKQEYMGAYVMEPKKGLINDVISFDLTSLYPSVIQAINISPETLCENEFDVNAGIEEFINGYIPIDFHNDNKIVDPAGNVFDKTKYGILPQKMKELFVKRINSKKTMQQKQKELQHYKNMLKELKNEESNK